MNYYFEVFKKYAVFKGRARRKEYWMFFLFNFIIALVLGLIEGLVGFNSENDESVLASIYQLVVLVPSLAVGVRRMHDINKSGWNLIIPIYNIVLLCTDGTKGDNNYGSDPKLENEEHEQVVDLKNKPVSTFCYKCGGALEAGSKFCTKCGAKVVYPPGE